MRYLCSDTRKWDAERNNREFVAAMPHWKAYGLNAITVNMQGGSPFGYGNFDFYNPGFNSDGSLNYAYMYRLENILKKADELEMVVILGLFYFGQDQRLYDEKAIKRAVTEMVNWLHDKKYRNVLIEINNETQAQIKHYDHEILLIDRVHELISLAKSIEHNGYRYNISTSFDAHRVPTPNVLEVSDYVLFHCNAFRIFDSFHSHILKVKAAAKERNIPIMINEDDNFAFETDTSHFKTAIENYISWGYFDYRKKGDKDLKNGFQTLPVDWGINSPNKKAFFEKVKEISGANGPKTTFKPNQDYIKIEAESTKSGLIEWLKIKKGDKNYVAGASGETFLEFLGNAPTMGSPNSPLVYIFTAPANGTYRLVMMNSKRLKGGRGDWCNDAYIKLEGDYQSHTGLDRNTLGQYLKFFQEGSVGTPELSWHWGLRAEPDKHEFFELIYKLIKGQSYSITLAGRSQKLSVDYLLLYNTDTMTLNQVKEQFEK